MQMHKLYCQHLYFHLLWCIQNQNQYIGKVIVIICRFYQEKYQIANTLESICIFSSQDDGWGLHTQRCDKAPTFANFKSSKATFVESTFLVLVDKDGGICSCWENKESPHISMVLKCTGEVTLTSRSTPSPQLFTFEALQFHLTVKCTSSPTLLLEYMHVKVFSSRILHTLNFRSPQVFFIFQFCFSWQSTKYFVFLYLIFLQHSTRYFFCWNWLGCSKLSKVCGQQGERKTNFPRDDGPWRKVFHLKNIFHLPLGQNKGKASKKREYCKSLFTFIVVYQIQVRSLPDLVNEQYFRILIKVLKLNSRNLSKSHPTSLCVIHHPHGQKLFHLKSSKLSSQSYRKVLSILWSQSLEY